MNTSHFTAGWQELPAFSRAGLAMARGQLHLAVQLVGLAGRSFFPQQNGDPYASMDWLPASKSLAGQWAGSGFRVTLNMPGFILKMESKAGSKCELPLDGRTFEEAFTWLEQHLALLGAATHRLSKALPYELTGYPPPEGQRFALTNRAAFQVLTCWYNEAHRVLSAIRGVYPDASEVRCWPHHFDMDTLINREAPRGKAIRVGMSPGDDSYDEPYFYVAPWSGSEHVKAGDLPEGSILHTNGWTGAVLLASTLTSGEAEQAARVEEFLNAGLRLFAQ